MADMAEPSHARRGSRRKIPPLSNQDGGQSDSLSDDEYDCEYDCGFVGTFDEVTKHEPTCSKRPVFSEESHGDEISNVSSDHETSTDEPALDSEEQPINEDHDLLEEENTHDDDVDTKPVISIEEVGKKAAEDTSVNQGSAAKQQTNAASPTTQRSTETNAQKKKAHVKNGSAATQKNKNERQDEKLSGSEVRSKVNGINAAISASCWSSSSSSMVENSDSLRTKVDELDQQLAEIARQTERKSKAVRVIQTTLPGSEADRQALQQKLVSIKTELVRARAKDISRKHSAANGGDELGKLRRKVETKTNKLQQLQVQQEILDRQLQALTQHFEECEKEEPVNPADSTLSNKRSSWWGGLLGDDEEEVEGDETGRAAASQAASSDPAQAPAEDKAEGSSESAAVEGDTPKEDANMELDVDWTRRISQDMSLSVERMQMQMQAHMQLQLNKGMNMGMSMRSEISSALQLPDLLPDFMHSKRTLHVTVLGATGVPGKWDASGASGQANASQSSNPAHAHRESTLRRVSVPESWGATGVSSAAAPAAAEGDGGVASKQQHDENPSGAGAGGEEKGEEGEGDDTPAPHSKGASNGVPNDAKAGEIGMEHKSVASTTQQWYVTGALQQCGGAGNETTESLNATTGAVPVPEPEDGRCEDAVVTWKELPTLLLRDQESGRGLRRHRRGRRRSRGRSRSRRRDRSSDDKSAGAGGAGAGADSADTAKGEEDKITDDASAVTSTLNFELEDNSTTATIELEVWDTHGRLLGSSLSVEVPLKVLIDQALATETESVAESVKETERDAGTADSDESQSSTTEAEAEDGCSSDGTEAEATDVENKEVEDAGVDVDGERQDEGLQCSLDGAKGRIFEYALHKGGTLKVHLSVGESMYDRAAAIFADTENGMSMEVVRGEAEDNDESGSVASSTPSSSVSSSRANTPVAALVATASPVVADESAVEGGVGVAEGDGEEDSFSILRKVSTLGSSFFGMFGEEHAEEKEVAKVLVERLLAEAVRKSGGKDGGTGSSIEKPSSLVLDFAFSSETQSNAKEGAEECTDIAKEGDTATATAIATTADTAEARDAEEGSFFTFDGLNLSNLLGISPEEHAAEKEAAKLLVERLLADTLQKTAGEIVQKRSDVDADNGHRRSGEAEEVGVTSELAESGERALAAVDEGSFFTFDGLNLSNLLGISPEEHAAEKEAAKLLVERLLADTLQKTAGENAPAAAEKGQNKTEAVPDVDHEVDNPDSKVAQGDGEEDSFSILRKVSTLGSSFFGMFGEEHAEEKEVAKVLVERLLAEAVQKQSGVSMVETVEAEAEAEPDPSSEAGSSLFDMLGIAVTTVESGEGQAEPKPEVEDKQEEEEAAPKDTDFWTDASSFFSSAADETTSTKEPGDEDTVAETETAQPAPGAKAGAEAGVEAGVEASLQSKGEESQSQQTASEPEVSTDFDLTAALVSGFGLFSPSEQEAAAAVAAIETPTDDSKIATEPEESKKSASVSSAQSRRNSGLSTPPEVGVKQQTLEQENRRLKDELDQLRKMLESQKARK